MLWNHQFAAKYGPRGPPRATYEPGGQGVAQTSIVSKGLKSQILCVELSRGDKMRENVPTIMFWIKIVIKHMIKIQEYLSVKGPHPACQ